MRKSSASPRSAVRQLEKSNDVALVLAAARLTAVRKPAGAAEVLLAFLPNTADELVIEEIQTTLAATAVCDGKPEPALTVLATAKEPIAGNCRELPWPGRVSPSKKPHSTSSCTILNQESVCASVWLLPPPRIKRPFLC